LPTEGITARMTQKGSLWSARFADYHTALQRYFRRRVGRREDIEELSQEVYLRLLRANETNHRTVNNPQAYVLTVAGNLLKERAILERRAAADVGIDEAALELATTDPTPEELLFRERRDRQVAAVIDKLPPRHRAVLLMHYHHEMTYRQIADRVGVSVHTIKKHLSQALALCRCELTEADQGP
jgi:RNA polymerase sigma factor (sigma-70 family)